MHYIMNKDIPVISIEEAKYINYDMAPLALQLKKLEYNKIYKWLVHRALPLNRKNADKIYMTMRLSRDNQEYELMCLTHALSINDNFWIANENELGVLRYKDINIFENSLNSTLYLVALKGYTYFTITEKNISAEYTGQGTYPKCFVRKDDGIYLYKSGLIDEITNEIYASYIADFIGASTINYFCDKISDIVCSVSKIETNIDINWETAFILSEHMVEQYGLIPQDVAIKYFTIDYSNMIILDALILNDDKHMKNWAFKIDSITNKIIGLAPNYDYNRAFKANSKSISNLLFDNNRQMNVLSAARMAYSNFGTSLNLIKLLNTIDFMDISINKDALKNRILYIIGKKSNQYNCF